MSSRRVPDVTTQKLNIIHTRKPNVAGIMNMVSGCLLCLASFGGCMNVINGGRTQDAWMLSLFIPGVLALVGGIYARTRKKWYLALVSSICAIPAVLGIGSIILIALSKREFE
jgi:hypothetical protein